MKRYISFILFSILLVACSSQVTNTPTPPTLTATFILPTATQIPTATSTPTQTPDPNMPPDATGKNAQGNYIKIITENGNTVTYAWTKIDFGGLPDNNFFEWTRPAIVDDNGNLDPNGILVIDFREYGNATSPSSIKMTLFLMDNSEEPGTFLYVSHPTPKGDYSSLQSQISNFSARAFNDLARSLGVRPRPSEFGEFVGQYSNMTTPLDITIKTPDGITQHWNPAADYTVTQVPADKATGKEFNENHDEINPDIVYRWRIMTDDQHNLKAFIAVLDEIHPSAPVDFAKLTNEQRARFVFAGLYEAITYANQTMPSYKNALHFEPSVQNGADKSIESINGDTFLTFLFK